MEYELSWIDYGSDVIVMLSDDVLEIVIHRLAN